MKPLVKLNFLGAAGTVTGSKFLIETPELHVMVDCGMFQGMKHLRELNWAELPADVAAIDLVILTHGHLDHVGYLPRLVKQGFKGKIIGTAPTLAIAKIILKDSAKIHEEDAEKANKEGYTKHKPALAFYTVDEAEKTLRLFKSATLNTWQQLSENIALRFQYNGHIIGATFVELDINGKRFVFSGDVGRKDDYLLDNPQKPRWADYLFLESTYGDKYHPKEDLEPIFIDLINRTINNKGNLIIPSFAVERLQTLMYLLWKLYKEHKIPDIPIYVDSPMGNNVLSVFEQFPKWHKLSMADYSAMCRHVNIISSYRETWQTIDNPRPKVVIAGSGMVTGGRVLTYLQQYIDRSSTTILLVGYQAECTRGRQLLDGAHEIKFYGKYYPVRATVEHIESLSAHADQNGLLDWLGEIKNIPECVYLIHGEANALNTFRVKLETTFNWNVKVPKLTDKEQLII
jgi:metallo-beta-lactamase family protein